MARRMSKTKITPRPAPRFRQRFHRIDMRDWLTWLDMTYELALAAGFEHRRLRDHHLGPGGADMACARSADDRGWFPRAAG